MNKKQLRQYKPALERWFFFARTALDIAAGIAQVFELGRALGWW